MPSATATGDVLLVGSVPFDTVDEVLETCAGALGARAYALPDGEIGHRKNWIQALPHLTYSKNPDLDPIRVVPPEQVKSPESHDPELMKATRCTYKLKAGVTETTLDLPYAREAINSYGIYKRLREEGKVDPSVRFQVSLPCTVDATVGFFPDPDEHPVIIRAYERAIQEDIQKILEHVPAKDLVIQWDYCSELLDIMGARSTYLDGDSGVDELATEARIRKYTALEYLAPMTETIPEEVPIGYHLCYGTWGGWPMTEVEDLSLCVRLANGLCANTPRRVDFFHLPAMREADEDFFRPLQNLDIGAAKVFLGIELADGVDEMMRRANAARKFLPDFGIAHYCGYGRETPERVRELLTDIAAGADQLAG